MISYKHRFHGYNSLRHVYRKGVSIRGPLFAIKSTINDRRDNYRLAVVVARKVHKSAVARNRMRRRLYEIVRKMEADIVAPYDIVITVFQPALLDEPADKLQQQVERQLVAAGIIKPRNSR